MYKTLIKNWKFKRIIKKSHKDRLKNLVEMNNSIDEFIIFNKQKKILRKAYKERNIEECDCFCHTNPGTMHMMACCNYCPICKRNIRITVYDEHIKKCGKI